MRFTRRAGRAPAPETPADRPLPDPAAREVDDLPDFFARPPGSPTPPAAPVTSPALPHAAPVDDVPDDGTPEHAPARRRRTAGLVAGATVVVIGTVAAVVVATGSGDDAASPTGGQRPTTPADAGTTTPPTSAPGTPSPTAAPLTAAAAGDLSGTDLPPGADGFTASASFAGVVLEPRAVGVTVAYPEVRVSSDGSSAVAHLDLPVWNCLGAEPPADPVVAQCVRSLEEFADLGSPELAVQRTGDRLHLTGAFATYTRPNGSAPAYTGRSYELTVQFVPSGTSATGTLTLGGATVGTSGAGSFSG